MPFTHVNSSVTSQSCNTKAATTSSRDTLALHDYQQYQAQCSRPQKRPASEALSLAEEKKQRRLAKNRATASVSRSRKREHLHNLQVRLCQLEQKNAQLSEKLAKQEDELSFYRQNANAPHDTCAPIVKTESAAVADVAKLSEAVVLRSAVSALPRIYCTANPPSASSSQDKPKDIASAPCKDKAVGSAAATYATPAANKQADAILNNESSRMPDPAQVPELDPCERQQQEVHTAAAAAETAFDVGVDSVSEDESASPSEVESEIAAEPALPSTSTQSNVKCEATTAAGSDGFCYLPALSLCQPDSAQHRSDSAVVCHVNESFYTTQSARDTMHEQLSPISMPPGSFLMSPEFTQPGLTPSLDFMRPNDCLHHQSDLGTATSCDLSSMEMAADLLDASISHFCTSIDMSQPMQPATWVSLPSQLDESARSSSLPHDSMRSELSKQTPGWSWSVTTGSSCMHLSSESTAVFSRMPSMPKAAPQAFTSWDQPTWDGSWQQQAQGTQHAQQAQRSQHAQQGQVSQHAQQGQHAPQGQSSQHAQQAQRSQHAQQQQQQLQQQGQQQQGMKSHWGAHGQCFSDWGQPDLAQISSTGQHSEQCVSKFAESESSWWSMPSCSAKGFEA